MIASFDRDELMASLAELEKRVREQTPSPRLAEAPSAQLDIDLAAILDLVRSRSPLNAIPIEDAARLVDDPPPDKAELSRSTAIIVVPEKELRASTAGRERAASAAALEEAARLADDPPPDKAALSRSTAIILVPEKELRASAAGKEIAPSRPQRWVYVPAAILIVIGSLVGSTGHHAGGRVLAALEAPPARQNLGPPPGTTAQAPAAEQAAEHGRAAAETAAVAPSPPPVAKAAPETAAQAPAAEEAAERGPAAAEAATAAPPPPPLAALAQPRPSAAKALVAVEPPAPAVAPPTPEDTIAKPAKPAKKRKKPMTGRSEFRAFTSQFRKLAGDVTAALRRISTSVLPQ